MKSPNLKKNAHGCDRHNAGTSPAQAARQGLAVLTVTAEVVLKHETSTTYQSHIYETIDLKCWLGDYVTRFSNLAKFGEDRFSGGPHVMVKYTGPVPFLFLFLFLYSLTCLQPIPILKHT